MYMWGYKTIGYINVNVAALRIKNSDRIHYNLIGYIGPLHATLEIIIENLEATYLPMYDSIVISVTERLW